MILSMFSISYFKAEPILETESGTYADREIVPNIQPWPGITASVKYLLRWKTGLSIETLEKYDSPYNCLANMVQTGPDEYRIAHLNKLIPLVYAIKAHRKI